MSAADTMVRMGELAVSTGPGDVLTSIGLGSCIGLALVDVDAKVAGLAHVMLPVAPAAVGGRHGGPDTSTGNRTGSGTATSRPGTAADDVGKFADTAAPALLEAVLAAGARRARLATYLVGGAQMFRFGGRGMDVGARNDQAVRDAVALLRLRIRATDTGGTKGRTIRVWAADGRVTVKEAGGAETAIAEGLRISADHPGAAARSTPVTRATVAGRPDPTDRTGPRPADHPAAIRAQSLTRTAGRPTPTSTPRRDAERPPVRGRIRTSETNPTPLRGV